MAITDTLKAIPLFAGLRQPELEALAERMRQRRYREGEAIFHRDDPGTAMYVILKGRVKIHTEEADGTDVFITQFSSGEFFGELSLLDGSDRSADATTMEPTEMLMLTRGELETAIDRYPRIALNMLASLARRIRTSTDSITYLSALDVRGRLARELLDLADNHGEKVDGGGTRINVKLTQSDLASKVAASRESVNKVISQYRRRGWLDYDDTQHLILLKPAELRKHCE